MISLALVPALSVTPGEEPDLDRVVEVGLGRPVYGVPLDDGVAELRTDLRELFGETSL